MSLFSPTFKLFAVGAVVALGMVGAIHSRAVVETEAAVTRSARYDMAWTGAAGRLEMLQLQNYVKDYLLTKDPDAAEQATLFQQILGGRLDIWEAGLFRSFVESSPKRRAELGDVHSMLDSLDKDFANLDDPGAQKRILAALDKMAPVVDRIGADAYSISVLEAEKFRNELRQRQKLQSYLNFGLIGAGALILVLMALQNRSLGIAHRIAIKNAADFAFLAHHDALTGLMNRIAFKDALESSASVAAKSGERLAVLAIDLDGFKAVNDLLGHATGDALLMAVAKRLKQLVETPDSGNIVSRFGGDEFVVLLHGQDTLSAIGAIAETVLADLSKPFTINGSSVMIGATVGYTISGDKLTRTDNLMLDADLALSKAKSTGKGVALAYEPGMRMAYERRGRLESDMKGAIANGDIQPHYQVQIDLVTNRVVGIEALARWSHPHYGAVSPGEFIPIAESSSQIVDIGRAVLERSCLEGLDFPDEVKVSVNLSVGQLLRNDLVETVCEVLQATGFPAHRLVLEVTESVMMSESDRAVRLLKRLKALGVSIALDDFGTGYSALAYLRQFDWDELKIDRSFVSDLGKDPRSLRIIKSVLELAQELGIKVVAEGIETVDQQEILREIGCDIGQGYLYGRAGPIADAQAIALRNIAGNGRPGSAARKISA